MEEEFDYEIDCPWCGHEVGIILDWEGGECPNCHNEYTEEERCTEDYSDCWAELDWDRWRPAEERSKQA